MKKFLFALVAMLPFLAVGQGWPSNYGGVMMQGFSWDDYTTTTWTAMTNNVDDYATYFELIWVPQSGQSADGQNSQQMGYNPCWWFNHNSCFGTLSQLKNMIATYKARGTGIIEDVVVNHKNGYQGWCYFPPETFTSQTTGKRYSITWDNTNYSGICNNDECNYNGYHTTGAADTGDNFDGSRDLDHTNAKVRENIKTYLNFLQEELGYIGFRYDMVKGFSPSYVAEYNLSAAPLFSVGEYYDDFTLTTQWIRGTYADGAYQSAAFDFALKFRMNDAFNNGSWGSLNNAGLAADGNYRRYAVTFVDNHDTYRGDGKISNNIAAANAFILAMPGTPCILKPHYDNASYKDAIRACIRGRRYAGVTNTSPIDNVEQRNGGITFWIRGEKAEVCIELGPDKDMGCPDGYYDVWNGDNFRYCVSKRDGVEPWTLPDKTPLPTGTVVVDKASGNYVGSVTVNVRPSVAGDVVVYTTDGTTPTASSAQLTTSTQFTFTETTTLKVGILSGGVVQQLKVYSYIITDTETNDITIYVRGSNPYLYAWDDDGILTATWPGTRLNNSKGVGGLDWSYKTFTKKNSGYTLNCIITEGNDGPQTSDITGVGHDMFYMFSDGTATDLTSTYISSVYNPRVWIDKASGEYEENTLSVSIAASYTDATIVYTTNGTEPTATNGTQVNGKTTLELSKSTSEQVVKAGLLINGSVTDVVSRVYLVKGGSSGGTVTPTKTGVTVYIYSDHPSNSYLYSWNASGTQRTGAWPGTKISTLPSETINGGTWYYKNFADDNKINIVLNNGNGTQTADITNITTDVYYYYPKDGNNYSAVYPETRPEYTERETGGGTSVATATMPACATWREGHVYCYFENDGNYTIPHIWAWGDNNANFTGGSWPGTQLVEPVGMSGNGNMIYVWDLGEASSAPTGLLFSDNGSLQTGDFTFVNGGYYTTGGLLTSDVDKSVQKLADVLKNGTAGSKYTVNNELTGVWFDPTGQYLYAKDNNGDAIVKYQKTAAQTAHDNPADFDQSNWVVIKFKSPQSAVRQQTFINHKIRAGTISGSLTDVANPTITTVVMPLAGDATEEYVPNEYVVANFVDQDEYFLMKPRPNEYAIVKEAVYMDNAFYMPVSSATQNPDDLDGAVGINLSLFDEECEFVNGKQYEIAGVIKAKTSSSSAPRRVTPKDSALSTAFELYPSSATEDESIITGIDVAGVAQKEVEKVEYYNVLGVKSDKPFAGVNVVVTTYTDGTRVAMKMVK